MDGLPLNGSFLPSLFVECNLFELTSNMLKGQAIAQFSPQAYPVVAPYSMKGNEESWKKLSSDLIKESKEHGNFPLTSNGLHGKDQKVLCCSRFRHYHATMHVASGEYCRHIINLNRNNAWQNDGKKQKKKTGTSHPIKSNDDISCKVKLVVGIDQHSFFLVCGLGNDTHKHTTRPHFLEQASNDAALSIVFSSPSELPWPHGTLSTASSATGASGGKGPQEE